MTNTRTTEQLLEALFRPAVEYNWIDKQYWKVIFAEGKAYVASGYHLVEISNLPGAIIQPKGLYYDFVTGQWGNNLEYPIGIEDMNRAFSQTAQSAKGCFDTNCNLLLQFVSSFKDDIRRNSRIVIASHQTKDDEVVVSFDIDEHGNKFSTIGGISVFISQSSQISPNNIIPRMPYVCKVENTSGNTVYVNVLASCGPIKMTMYYSNGCFIMDTPETTEQVHDMRGVPQEFMYTAFKVVNGYKPNPVHLDAGMFTDVAKTFSLTNDQFVRIATSDDPNKPILLESLGDPENIKVRAVIATLNPFTGPQRR